MISFFPFWRVDFFSESYDLVLCKGYQPCMQKYDFRMIDIAEQVFKREVMDSRNLMSWNPLQQRGLFQPCDMSEHSFTHSLSSQSALSTHYLCTGLPEKYTNDTCTRSFTPHSPNYYSSGHVAISVNEKRELELMKDTIWESRWPDVAEQEGKKITQNWLCQVA